MGLRCIAGLPEEWRPARRARLENAVIEGQDNLFDESLTINQSQYCSGSDDYEDELFKRFHEAKYEVSDRKS